MSFICNGVKPLFIASCLLKSPKISIWVCISGVSWSSGIPCCAANLNCSPVTVCCAAISPAWVKAVSVNPSASVSSTGPLIISPII